jgi:hypothetical protein
VLWFVIETCHTERCVVNGDEELPASVTGVLHLFSGLLASFHTAFRFDAYGAIKGTNIHAVLPLQTADWILFVSTFLPGSFDRNSRNELLYSSRSPVSADRHAPLIIRVLRGDSSIALEESLGRGRDALSLSTFDADRLSGPETSFPGGRVTSKCQNHQAICPQSFLVALRVPDRLFSDFSESTAVSEGNGGSETNQSLHVM